MLEAAELEVPPVTDKDLRRELKILGKHEALEDRAAIPTLTASIRESYLPQLGGRSVFTAFGDIFTRAKGVAHRKALLYVVHELFMGKRGSGMKPKGRRECCLEHFLLRIGSHVVAFKADERQAYQRALSAWKAARVMLPNELQQVKDAWDMD